MPVGGRFCTGTLFAYAVAMLPGSWLSAAGAVFAISLVVVLAALIVVPRNRKPGSATAWLMLIAGLPIGGALLFFLIGSPKLSRRRREQQRRADALIAERVEEARAHPELQDLFDPEVPARYLTFVQLNSALGGMPACSRNDVRLIADYSEAVRRMIAAVDEATSFVHVEFYILALDAFTEPFFAAMERAVRRGVNVRLLADYMGSRWIRGRERMMERLHASGIDWHWVLPVRPLYNAWNRPDLRNHRKIVVVDGHTAFTGSMNMIAPSYLRASNERHGRTYVETVAEVTGPAVLELNAVFLTDWYSEKDALITMPAPPRPQSDWKGPALCQILPSGPGYDNDNNLKLFTSLIHAARRSVFITTPYFVPEESLMMAVTSAAQRGVGVTLLTGAITNELFVKHAQHSYYEELLAAGVRIFRLREPEILHAKHMSIDDDIAVIGSSNLDMRSFTLNLEVTLVAYDAGVVTDLRRVEQELLKRSDELVAEEWDRRWLPGRVLDNIARLTAALQ
jgi:cardiolipin synthase